MSAGHYHNMTLGRVFGGLGLVRNPFTEKMRFFVNTGQTDAEVFRKLIDEGGDVKSIEPCSGFTLLRIAASRNFPNTIRMLLSFEECAFFKKTTESNCCVVRYTAEKGQTECLRALIDGGMKFDNGGLSGMAPIHAACERGHIDCVVLLLDAGVDVNRKAQQGGTPFTYAAKSRSILLLELLIERGARYGSDECLHIAVHNGDMDMIRFLLDLGYNINATRWYVGSYNTPLWIAVRAGLYDVASFLIDNGADVNGVGAEGRTCLSEACFQNHLDIVHLLLRNGADVDLYGENELYGKGPLYFALYDILSEVYVPVIDALLAFGANVNKYTHRHLSPLYMAFARDIESAKKLIVLGADVFDITSKIKEYADPYEAEIILQRQEVIDLLANVPFPLSAYCTVKDNLSQLKLEIMSQNF